MDDPTPPLTACREDDVSRTTSAEIIPVVEETAAVLKREVATRRVRLRTLTDWIEELARPDLHRETVEVTHVPVDRIVETEPAIRSEGEAIIVPVVEEVLFVEKRLVLRKSYTSSARSG